MGTLHFKPNGPAVCFSKRNPTTAPPRICPGRPENCPGARRVWRVFLPSRCKFLWGLRVSRDKFDRSHEVITGYKTRWEYLRSVAVQVWTELEDYNGTQGLLRVMARIRVEQLVGKLLSGTVCKNRDKLIKHTVRVSRC